MQLVESVPNFSEGQRKDVIDKIVSAISTVKGAYVLDLTSDPDHNRSVVTLVGEPAPILEALFRCTEKASELIDLNKHKGTHPRIGAMDVIPLIPFKGIAMKECIDLSRELGQRIASELRIPVYLYAESATVLHRKRLPDVRKEEFEGLKEEIGKEERRPDFGEPYLHPTAGAVAVGARKFILAYNVNLKTTDLKVAEKVAKAVRESSGGLVNVQSRGMELKEQGIIQVSMNLMDFEVTPLYRAYELVKLEAQRFGAEVLESEIIGLPPARALIQSLAYYIRLKEPASGITLEERLLEYVYD